jgi:hypothetical protein
MKLLKSSLYHGVVVGRYQALIVSRITSAMELSVKTLRVVNDEGPSSESSQTKFSSLKGSSSTHVEPSSWQ